MAGREVVIRKYPFHSFAPGNYWCCCVYCGEHFIGAKRSLQCEPCAEKQDHTQKALDEALRIQRETGEASVLTVELKMNGRPIAAATVKNISDLAPISDYEVEAVSLPSKYSGKGFRHAFTVNRHERLQTAWALIAKVADRLAQVEKIEEAKGDAA